MGAWSSVTMQIVDMETEMSEMEIKSTLRLDGVQAKLSDARSVLDVSIGASIQFYREQLTKLNNTGGLAEESKVMEKLEGDVSKLEHERVGISERLVSKELERAETVGQL